MQDFKKILQKGFVQRAFELILIEKEADNIPWWIEERWTINTLQTSNHTLPLFVTFLTERAWKNGPKTVEEILLSTSKMENYLDRVNSIVSLDMRKGNFDEKMTDFWDQLDAKLKTLR